MTEFGRPWIEESGRKRTYSVVAQILTELQQYATPDNTTIDQEKNHAINALTGFEVIFERRDREPPPPQKLKIEAVQSAGVSDIHTQPVPPENEDKETMDKAGSDTQIPIAEIIFNKNKLEMPKWTDYRIKRLIPIPRRTKLAGKHLQAARERADISEYEMAQYISFSVRALQLFERGQLSLDLDSVLSAAYEAIYEEDLDMIKLRNIVEEQSWARTLSREGMTLGRAGTFIRLDLLLDKRHFAQKAFINEGTLGSIEHNGGTNFSEVNKLIAASRLEPMGIPAQMIRLLCEKRSPMEFAELQSCSFGKLFQYIRQLMGASHNDVVKSTGLGESTIDRIEADKGNALKITKKKLLHFLDLHPESALAKIATRKIENPKKHIPYSLIKEVISGEHDGRYLFAEMLKDADISEIKGVTTIIIIKELEAKRRQLAKKDESSKIIGTLLMHLRERKSLSRQELAQRSSVPIRTLSAVETGEEIPKDDTIMKILLGMEVDIQNPVAWYMLDIAATLEQSLS